MADLMIEKFETKKVLFIIFYVCKDSSVLIVFKTEKKNACKSKILVEFYFKCYVL